MIGIETRQNFIDLLLTIGSLERETEVYRQVLCKQEAFEPYATFKRLDRTEKGFLTPDDLCAFLESNSCQHDIVMVNKLTTHYDSDFDGKLVYTEFLRMILPMDNPDLRTHVAQRPNYDIDRSEFLSYDIEYCLTRLVDKEINLFKELGLQKGLLLDRYDFNIKDCQKVIDKGGSGTLNFENLEKFFTENGFLPYDEEIVCILRRIDKDDDGRVTMDELVEFFNMIPNTPSVTPKASLQQKQRVNSPSREKILRDSPDRKIVQPNISKTRVNEYTRQREVVATRDLNVSPMRSSQVEVDNKPINSNWRGSAEKEVQQTLTNSSFLRSSAEKTTPIKNSRPSNSNINDSNQKSETSSRFTSDFGKKLSVSNVNAGNSQINSIKKMSTSSNNNTEEVERKTSNNVSSTKNGGEPDKKYTENIKNYSVTSTSTANFNQEINVKSSVRTESLYQSPPSKLKELNELPTTKTINKTTPTRNRDNGNERAARRASPPRNSGSTHSARVAKMLKEFITFDRETEVIKQDLALRPDFCLLDAFKLIDRSNKAYITNLDLSEFLERLGIPQNKENLFLIFNKYDSDEDKKWKLADFSEMICPKQPEYKSLINTRAPLNTNERLSLVDVFSAETKRALTNALKTIFENERSIEEIRQRVSSLNVSLQAAFKEIDNDKDGLLSRIELRRGLEDNDILITEKDLSFLVERLDADRDGSISLSEFLQELTPKLD